MTTPDEPAAAAPAKPATKLPLIKRLVIAVRGGSGGGMIAVAIVGGLILLLIVGAVIFSAGVAVAVKRNNQVEAKFKTELKSTREELAAAIHDKESLESKVRELKELSDAQAIDMKILRDSTEKIRMEKEALDKVLETVQARLSGAATGKPGAPVSNCDNKTGAIRNKHDLECLQLREKINAMNGGSSKAAGPAEDAKPAPKPAAHGGH